MPVAGLAASAANAIYKIGTGIKQENLADQVNVPDATYTVSPYAKNILGMATNQLNSQMPGYGQAENQIAGNFGATAGAIGRNATSGSQALSLIMGANNQANKADNSLETEQEQYHTGQVNNWNNANQVMIGEGDKVYQDAVRKQMLAIQQKNALRQSGITNVGNGIGDVGTGLAMTQNQLLLQKLYGGNNTGAGAGYQLPAGATY